MADLFTGYNPDFLEFETKTLKVNIPILGEKNIDDVAPVEGSVDNVLHYINYSVQMSKKRKFPIFTASNIDGGLFKKAIRAKSWKKDSRLQNHQWGTELYSAPMSNFDKGHMTKREDVQWGDTPGLAQLAADSTFFYTNAVPQHRELNQEIWKSLEDYILHSESRERGIKICVFTGPVLSNIDPLFVSRVQGQEIKLPVVFWKVVYYLKSDGIINRVGFMMSQNQLLLANSIVEEIETERATEEDLLFMQFDDAATYQVNISIIERLTGLTFQEAVDAYYDDRPQKLVMEEIEIDPELESDSIGQFLGFTIQHLAL